MAYVRRNPEAECRVWVYKIYPTARQARAMEETLEVLRHLYNNALAERIDAYRFENRTITGSEQKKQITALRRENEILGSVNVGCAQQVLIRLDRAYDAFFRRLKAGETPGFPRFRRFGEWRTCQFNNIGNGCAWRVDRPYFQGVGTVKCDFYRPLPEGAVLRNMSYTKHANGWFVNVTLEVIPPAVESSEKPALGIAIIPPLGYVDSEGLAVEPPGFYEAALGKLAKAQQRVSRRIKGSGGRHEAVQLLGRHHRHVALQRKEARIVIVNAILERAGTVFIEDVKMSDLLTRPMPQWDAEEGRYLPNLAAAKAEENRAISDRGWGDFVNCLKAQARSRGVVVIPVAVGEEIAGEADPYLRAQMIYTAGMAA